MGPNAPNVTAGMKTRLAALDARRVPLQAQYQSFVANGMPAFNVLGQTANIGKVTLP